MTLNTFRGININKHKMSDIISIRKKIDFVNESIVNLLIERKVLSMEIGKIKRSKGIPVYDPSREKSIYDTLKSKYPDDYEYIKPIFESIILSSRNVQR